MAEQMTQDRELVETVSFKIEGEYLTEIARQWVLEGKWYHAFKTLCECLGCEYEGEWYGISYQDATAILKGEKKLVGCNTVDIVDEDEDVTADFKKDLDRLYGKVWKFGNKWYKPYAYVSSVGWEDVHEKENSSNVMYGKSTKGDLSCDWGLRVYHYADNSHTDIAYNLYDSDMKRLAEEVSNIPDNLWNSIILLKECPNLPIWMTPEQDLCSVLISFFKTGHHLEERGWHLTYGPEHEALYENNEQDRVTENETEPETKPETTEKNSYEDLIKSMPPELQQGAVGVLNYMQGQVDLETEPIPSKTLTQSGWITRDGKFFPCEYMEHFAMASRILEHHTQEEAEEIEDCQKYLEQEHGAIRIQKSSLSDDIVLGHSIKKTVTKRQRETLQEWCAKFNQPLPDWAKEE